MVSGRDKKIALCFALAKGHTGSREQFEGGKGEGRWTGNDGSERFQSSIFNIFRNKKKKVTKRAWDA